MIAAGLAVFASAAGAAGGWRGYLSPPEDYVNFPRRVERTAVHRCAGFDVEVYRQANGPGTFQRVMMAVPRGLRGKLPAVAVPFYFPEAMLGFDPATGGLDSPNAPEGTNLTFYSEVAYMGDLSRRGYITISADAYHLTYAVTNAGAGFHWWRHAGEKLTRDHPGWTGIGKLAFDTRLLVDMLSADVRVDAGRIGIIGHSLGGKMAFYAGCLDPRIKVMVASDFGMGWDQTNWQDVWYWGDKLKEVRAAGFDHAGLLSLSGGKPFCLIAGKSDDESSGAMMRRAKGYGRHPERLLLVNHASGHRPPPAATETGYRFLDRYLAPAAALGNPEWFPGGGNTAKLDVTPRLRGDDIHTLNCHGRERCDF